MRGAPGAWRARDLCGREAAARRSRRRGRTFSGRRVRRSVARSNAGRDSNAGGTPPGPGRTRRVVEAALGDSRAASASGSTTTRGIGRRTYASDRDVSGRLVALAAAPVAHLRDLCAETVVHRRALRPAALRRRRPRRRAKPITGLDGNARLGLADAPRRDRARRRCRASATSCCFTCRPRRAGGDRLDAFAAPWSRRSRARFGDALHLWVDICLCASTDDGHCAINDDRTARST